MHEQSAVPAAAEDGIHWARPTMFTMRLARLLIFLVATPVSAMPTLRFVPADPTLVPAAEEYRRIWEQEGQRMVDTLESTSGATFPAAPIEVHIVNGNSMMSFDGRTMRLRANHSPEQKRAVLLHELGHRLAFSYPRTAELDDHRLLFLFLYDAYCDLYGASFADLMVAAERRSTHGYDYDGAWGSVLSLTRAERQARLLALRSLQSPSPVQR